MLRPLLTTSLCNQSLGTSHCGQNPAFGADDCFKTLASSSAQCGHQYTQVCQSLNYHVTYFIVLILYFNSLAVIWLHMLHFKNTDQGLQNGSVHRSTGLTTWTQYQVPHVGREGPTPDSWPLTFKCALWHTCPSTPLPDFTPLTHLSLFTLTHSE